MKSKRKHARGRLLIKSISPSEMRRIKKCREISEALLYVLEVKNISRSEFAVLMHKDNKIIKEWLSGTHTFNLPDLYNITEKLGLL